MTRDPVIKHKFNQINNITKKLLAEHTNEEFTDFLLTLDATKDTNYTLYKVARAARGPPCYKPPLRTPDGGWARTDLEQATTLASYLATTFQERDIPSPLEPNPQPEVGGKMEHISP